MIRHHIDRKEPHGKPVRLVNEDFWNLLAQLTIAKSSLPMLLIKYCLRS